MQCDVTHNKVKTRILALTIFEHLNTFQSFHEIDILYLRSTEARDGKC